jgi:hypothetical protein
MRLRNRAVQIALSLILVAGVVIWLVPPKPAQLPRFLEPFREQTIIEGPEGDGHGMVTIGLTTTYSIHVPPRVVLEQVLQSLGEEALEFGMSPGLIIIHDRRVRYVLSPGRRTQGSNQTGVGWTTVVHEEMRGLSRVERWMVSSPIPYLDWRYGKKKHAQFEHDQSEPYLAMWRALRSKFYARLKGAKVKGRTPQVQEEPKG